MNETPRFSVVIPTCERPDQLALGLERLAPGRQTLGRENYEAIVSDDGAATSAEEVLRARFPWARWTPGPQRGPAANRNHGAAQAAGEWLAFVDDDCEPDAEWLAAFAAAADAGAANGVLEGRTLARGPRDSIDTEAPVNSHGGFLWSCNFAIRRELFAELGGFDERFPGPAMEDVDFCLRLRKRGIEPAFVPGALVHHQWRRRKGRDHMRVYARSVDYYLSKHPEQAGLFTIPRSFRNLAARLVRDGGEALRQCSGRGLLRHAGLETYRFMLLTAQALRRRKRNNHAGDEHQSRTR